DSLHNAPTTHEPHPPEPDKRPPPAIPTTPAAAEALNSSDQFASRLEHHLPAAAFTIASGEKAKARDILAAIRAVRTIEEEHRPATPEERQMLACFAGFGPVALSIFPDPVTGR